MEDWKNALSYLKKQRVLVDSLAKKERQYALVEMQTKYGTGRKEKRIQLLQVKNELHARTRNALWGGIIGLLLISVLAIYGLRIKIKKNHAEQLLVQSRNELLTKDLAMKEQQLVNCVKQVKKKNELLEQLQSEL